MWVKFLMFVGVLFPVFCEKTAVLILARGGSKGIRLKNLQNLGGISLLGRTVLIAKYAGFQDVTVSTDHPLIAFEALKYQAGIFRRSFATSTDWAPSIWGVAEFIESRPEIEVLILLQATSPFIKPESLRTSLTKLSAPISYDCIFSVTRSFKLRWNHNSLGTHPINFEQKNRPRRQDWDGEFIETGAFYIARRQIITNGYLQNNKY